MASLENILNTKGFKIGIELVSTRGTTHEEKAQKVLNFGEQLSNEKEIDWISITDNAGGHPAISASTIGRKLANKGKEIIVHLTCKDYNRNGLESKAWELSSDGLSNILAISGDYTANGIEGLSKPVFDLDSVSLLHLLQKLNTGLEIGLKKKVNLNKTNFYLGAVISNFKKNENELVPQYIKLLKKIEMGAAYIINQVGYDSVKMSELISFQKYKNLENIHLIGNVFVLSKFTMNLFHKNKIPGVELSDVLYNQCKKATESADKGKSFFLELAAKMLAIYKGLGYKGGYFGGIHNINDYQKIMQIFNDYAPNDWKQFYNELQFMQTDDFYLFEKDPVSGITNPEKINPSLFEKGKKTKNVNLSFAVSKNFHQLLFTKNSGLYNTGKSICSKHNKAPNWLYGIEKIGKKVLFNCKDCGDCSLEEINYLCPESQCAKNQRNGPCGGSSNTICESTNLDCIWTKAYDRQKYSGTIWELLNHSPVIQNHKLRGTSSWANYWLGKDHTKISKENKLNIKNK
jgi:methylenetetrahydrofolate reductase (NADPH)